MIRKQQVLKSLNPVWVSVLCVFPAFTPDALGAGTQAAKKYVYSYDVYAGGFHVVEAQLSIDETAEEYKIELAAHTRGFLGRLAPWQGIFATEGWKLSESEYRPRTHTTTTTWRDEDEIKTYSYAKDGRFLNFEIDEHDKPLQKKVPDKELTDKTTDVLSATLTAMQGVAAERRCAGRAEIFDGKRRFAQVFTHEDTEELTASRYNIYEGPSVVCTVEVEPLAGKWHEKPRGWMSIQEQGRERGTMPTIWVGQVAPEATPVPVKIRVKTAYGTLFMHLTDMQKI